ncbi:MAG TPA: N-6 DNA methylase [Acidimicrobiales bacterium]|nr:N-6 DNA methylase [Acidimicrobiales bacterium]
MSAGQRNRYIAAAVDASATRGVRAVLADIGGHLAPGRDDLPLVARQPSADLAPPPELAVPDLLGAVYEATLPSAERRRRGAFYTPAALALALARATLAGLPPGTRVWDPAVGGGALLLAAARVLVGAGADPATAVSAQVGGVDTDPLAVDVAATALGILGGAAPAHVAVGDGLSPPGGEWGAVIANPPFRGQLKRGTARSRDDAAALSDRFGSAAAGYADDAGLFLLAAVEAVRAGGAVGFVLPAPLLATRDARPVREAVGAKTTLVRLWAPAATFDAGVRVVLAVARKEPPGPGATPAWGRGEWAVLARGADGPPLPRLRSDGTVGDAATVTADFRDQYYAVVAATREGGREGAPVVTCGLLDPARVLWGERPARIGRRSWSQPRAVLTGPAAAWGRQRLVPKVMVATQTPVIEAAADEDGRWLPAVPVIAAEPRDVDVWALLAAMLAPAVSALARRRHAGAALSPDAIKLSAKQVAALPLPADRAAWAAGAEAARAATLAGRSGDIEGWQAALVVLGDAMDEAYASRAPAVRAWWWERVVRVGARGP